MATQFQHDCPHCLTKFAGFTVAYQWAVRGSSVQARLLTICGVCTGGMIVLARSLNGNLPNLIQHSATFPGSGYSIDEYWPRYTSEVPTGTPENIGQFYLQGVESLHSGRWDAAGAMFRKTLDASTKSIAPAHKSLNLYKRINKLVEEGLLTAAMGDWSHEIRLDGNDAVHGDEPETEDDARKAQKFTEAFLQYAFTLPALVSGSRAVRSGKIE
ncbi:hypothetical protein FHS95_003636 [Sphingomonas naasensis]|uniref:DUF4145 domain-containing protein n=1 Tax=Sphingomonas naasensis TaxID=1344951 RepID=UPI00141B5316|nr:DUF4145 domain-containing protein [Sphingomonas naasensis]NIJ21925.1 hypothetical protein [Sphingomonas naasensis]